MRWIALLALLALSGCRTFETQPGIAASITIDLGKGDKK